MPSSQHFAALRAKKRKLAHSKPAATSSSNPPASSSKLPPAFRTATPGTLPWKSIVLPTELGFDEDGGLLELDEVEGVDVVYGDGAVTFKVREEGETAPAKNSNKGKGKGKGKEEASAGGQSLFPDEELSFLEEDEEEGETVKEQPAEEPKAKAQKAKKVKEKQPKGKKRQLEEMEGSAEEAVARQLEEVAFDPQTSLPDWAHLSLATPLYRALHELGFTKPTAVQERSLLVEAGSRAPAPAAATDGDNGASEGTAAVDEEEWGGIADDAVPSTFHTIPSSCDRDIVGVAQTGSGKTLAYGLPILSHILRQPSPSSTPRSPSPALSESSEPDAAAPSTRLAALILCPTRELALQVRASLTSVAVRTLPLLPRTEAIDKLAEEDPRKRQKGRLVNVVALTGGMSIDKQKRQLEKGADVIVATPGRLWDLIGESDNLVREIKGMKFLVIDEADRMIENGHFAELENIVRLTKRRGTESEPSYVDDFTSASQNSHVDLLSPREDMRTFVFSATMSKELQRNVKRKPGGKRWVPKTAGEDAMSRLDDLIDRLDFRDRNPEIIDLSPEHGLVETLKECKVECLVNEKDVHLYHFLIRYPARTIVFLASIDGIRRLHPLLQLLGLNVLPLHSGMQQRQRLKALDRFKSSPTAILLATDVAARGLDIPSVSHVVHYQLPRSADTYVHRSGRTARAGQAGLALQLVAPEEKNTQRMLMAGLGKSTELPSLPAEFSILDQVKKRVELAKQIDQAQHKATKEAHDDAWLRDAAAAMEIDLDDDQLGSDDPDAPQTSSKKQRSRGAAQVRDLKAQLHAMLSKPLMVRGVSAKYLTTRGTVGFVDQLVGGTGHAQILGVETSTALDDLPAPAAKKKAAKPA
ncbi:hypothetical protein JCM21900_000114 [Sporobolomyces salmonicolor]